jgi:broad specificity phosphatase PhoE
MVRVSLLAALLSLCTAAVAQEGWWAGERSLPGALQEGGYVIVFRHGATNREAADTDPLHLDNVDKQRQLNSLGRRAAAEVGGAIKTLHIPVGQVYTSRFQRAVETAQLIAGKDATATLDVSEGGLVVSPNENDRRSAALRKLAATSPARGTNTVVITHKPNIVDAFGKDVFDVGEGEAVVFKPDGAGHYVLVGRLLPSEWLELAAGGDVRNDPRASIPAD